MYFLGIIYLYIKHKSLSLSLYIYIYITVKVATVVVVVGEIMTLGKKKPIVLHCFWVILHLTIEKWEFTLSLFTLSCMWHSPIDIHWVFFLNNAHPINWEGFSLGNSSLWAYPTQGMHLFFPQSPRNWILLSLEVFPTYQRLQSLDELSTKKKKKKKYQGMDVNVGMLVSYWSWLIYLLKTCWKRINNLPSQLHISCSKWNLKFFKLEICHMFLKHRHWVHVRCAWQRSFDGPSGQCGLVAWGGTAKGPQCGTHHATPVPIPKATVVPWGGHGGLGL
jgi:hypothetical protein